MKIVELKRLTKELSKDVLALMKELDPELTVTEDMINNTIESPLTHFFVMMDDKGSVIGCASLCVYYSPTGMKASVEDVVVSSAYRGQHLGRKLMEHLIDYARKDLKNVELHLTSRPHRIAANELYKSLGFRQKETNVYIMKIKE